MTFLAELLCLWNCALFTKRHIRYGLISLAVYGTSLLRWKRTRLLRTGFVILQWIDDCLDGDRKCENPREQVLAILERRSHSPLVIVFWKEVAGLSSELKQEWNAAFEKVVQAMLVDYERRTQRQIWPEQKILSQMRETFEPSLDLNWIARESLMRSRDVPELIDAMGWASIARDLADDLKAGIYNVPEEVILECSEKNIPLGPNAEPVIKWLGQGARKNGVELSRLERRLPTVGDAVGRKGVRMFSKSILRRSRVYLTQNSDVLT